MLWVTCNNVDSDNNVDATSILAGVLVHATSPDKVAKLT